MKKLTPILIFIFLFIGNFITARENGDKNKTKYKVTAIKKGESAITSESNIVEINLPLSIYIPNAFTPNGDGLNDGFGIAGEGIAEFNMNVFNKWGELIFETNNIQEQWDGTYGGEFVQDGSYVYKVKLRTADKKSLVKSGTVTVLK